MSQHTAKKIRIGIDCRLGGLAHAGIGRYIGELLKEILQLQPEYTWVLITQSKEQAAELLASIPQLVQKNCEVCVVAARPYSVAEQILMPLHLYGLKLDLLHVPHFNVPILYFRKVVITVHDLLWHEQRGLSVTTLSPFVYWIKYVLYRCVAWWAVTTSKHIFVPSAVVKNTIHTFYPNISAEKITVTHESIGSELQKAATIDSSKQERKKHALLYVGSVYPHKNVSLIIAALKKLPEYSLQVVGSRSVFLKNLKKQIGEAKVEKQVQFLGRLSDAELAKVYAHSQCVIQPSFSEGFGLTGLEAMAFATPVLASDIPVFHEIYQDAAAYFDPHSVDSLIEQVRTLEDPTVWSNFQKKATAVRAQYSWQTLAEKTLAAYVRAL